MYSTWRVTSSCAKARLRSRIADRAAVYEIKINVFLLKAHAGRYSSMHDEYSLVKNQRDATARKSMRQKLITMFYVSPLQPAGQPHLQQLSTDSLYAVKSNGGGTSH